MRSCKNRFMRPQLFPRHISSDFDFDFSDTPNCGRGTLLSDKNADLGSNQSHEHALPNLFQIKQLNHSWLYRAVANGVGVGGSSPPPVFVRTVNPISTRGAEYVHHSTRSPPPGFSDLATALLWFVFKARLEHHFGIFIWQIILHQFASSELVK